MPDCHCDQSKKPTTFDRGKVKYDKTNPIVLTVSLTLRQAQDADSVIASPDEIRVWQSRFNLLRHEIASSLRFSQ